MYNYKLYVIDEIFYLIWFFSLVSKVPLNLHRRQMYALIVSLYLFSPWIL